MSRWILVCGLLALGCSGYAQEVPQKADPSKVETLPNQDVGSGQQGVLPPADGRKQQKLTIVNADKATTRGTVTVFEGNVHLEYKGYTLKADRIEGDTATDIYKLTGGGSLRGEGDSIDGEEIEVDFRQDTYSLLGGKAVITPTRTQGLTTGPFYVTGGKASLRDPHFHLSDGVVTPCDLDHPHFAFDARSTEVVPGKKIVFRDFGLVILGKRVLGLPYLYIPLLDDRPRYLPEIGQSQDEGYFIKSRYITPLRGEDRFETRLDYMTKLGFGVGGELAYDTPDMLGSFGVYGLTGRQNSLVANFKHQQALGASRLDVDARLQRNNYLTAPTSSLLTSRAQLTVPSGAGQSTLGYFRNSSDTGAFASLTESITASDVRQYGRSTRTTLSTTWSKSQSINSGTVLSESERVDVRFQGYQDLRSFAADLLFQRSIPIGDAQSFSNSSDRTPLLTLRSDTTRLLGPQAGRNWPTRLEASIGELRDPGGAPITRITLNTDLNRREELGRGFSLDWNGIYRQGLYSDDTAQYVLGYGGNLRYQFGSNSNLRLSYRNQKQFGFTPLAIDLTGQNDVFQFGADINHGKGWISTLATGYDVLAIERQQTPWQIATLSTTYNGSKSYFQFAANYDTFNQTWGLFRADSQFEIGGTGIALSARYDGQRAVWGAGSLQIEGFKWGQLTTNAVIFYNGYTKQIEAQQYQISYDLHCTEAVLELTDFRSGFRSGRQIAFYIRIKALPFGSDFGTGRRGQSIGGTGGFGF